MKLKIVTLLLVCTMFAGCGQNTDTSLGNTNINEITTQDAGSEGQDSQIQDDEAVQEQENMTDEAIASEGEETTSENNADKEPYVLNFEASTIEGENLTSDIFADSKLTMINVWATYCNPCLSEMPDLGEMAASYDTADFQIIGIISDVMEGAAKEDIANAKDLIAQTNANYPHLLLNESLYSNLVGAVSSVPTTYFINQKGEMLGYVVGARAKEEWEAIINELKAEIE